MSRFIDCFNTLVNTPNSIPKLRDTILQLAVMGKLVSQDPNDQPANYLLKEIEEEKRRLVKEGKIKQSKPLPEIKPEEMPFKLPEGWEWIRVGALTLLITDGTHHTPRYLNDGVPFISIKDIDGKTVSFSDCKYISKEEHQQINSRCNPELGDILLCRIGTLGRPTIVDTELPFSLFVSVGLLKLPKSSDISKYFHLALKSPLLYSQYDKVKAGGSHTNKLNLVDIPLLLLPTPPLAEQQRIVAKVDQLMALCDELEERQKKEAESKAILNASAINRLLVSDDESEFNNSWGFIRSNFDLLYSIPENVKKLKETILQLAIQGKLVPQDPNDEPASELLMKIQAEKERLIKEGTIRQQKPLPPIESDEVPYELPKGWEWARLPDLVLLQKHSIKRGPFGSAIRKEYFVPEGYKVYEQKNAIYDDFSLGTYYIDEYKFNELRQFEVRPKDIIISCSGTIGKVAIAPEMIEQGIINQALLKLSLNTNVIENEFFCMVFSSYLMQTSALTDLKGTAMKNIMSVDVLKTLPMPVPPHEEQHRIIAKVNQLMSLCDELEAQLKKSQQDGEVLMQSVLHEALTA